MQRYLPATFLAPLIAAMMIPQIAVSAPTLRLQDADAEATPLTPKVPRSSAVQSRVEALSWYATGRLMETRGEAKAALNAYRKAIELDPQAVEAYRSLVPLAMQLDMADEAIRLAMKAVELDPEDYELQLRIGVQFARQRDFATGIKYLEQALNSPRLKRESPTSVMLSIELGVLYQVTGQADKAAERYALIFDAIKSPKKYDLDFRARSALLSDPRTGYERIGQVLMDGGKLDLASEAFELAAKANRVSPGNLTYNRAKILFLSDKPTDALAELQKYFDAQRQSKGRDAYQLLADVLKKLNRSDELIGRLEALAELDPRNNQLQYFYADTLRDAGELDRAKQVYEDSLKGGGDATGYFGLAGVLRRMKRAGELLDVLGRGLSKITDEGQVMFDAELKAVVADATLVDALLEAGRAQAKAEPPQLSFEESFLLAKVASELKRFETAIEFYRLASNLDKDRAVVAYRDLCELLMDEKRYAEAATAYSDALKLRAPPELKARFFLGLTQSRELAGDTPGALEAVAEARAEFPQVPLFEFQEAWIYYHSHQLPEAVTRFEQLMETHAENKDIVRRCQFSLSAIYVMQGNIAKGEAILEKVFAEDPQDPSVNNDLGYLYADQGKKLEQAEEMIRKALASDPDNAAYLDSLGWVLFKRDKLQEALAPLEKAVATSTGGDSTIFDHLGDCYHRLNRLPDAITAWEKALKQAEAEKYPDAKLIEKIKVKLKDNRPTEGKPAPAKPGNP